jgi:hypothetical protein
MPSVSKKQHGFMAAIANNPKFAKKVGVSKSVGEDYMKADKGRKFKEGGLKETNADSNPGLAKLPTEVRNKMGYMKKGGMAKKRKFEEGGEVDTAALREAAMYGGLGKRNPRLPSEGIEQKYENPVTKRLKDAVAKTYSLSPSGMARSVANMGANAGRRSSRSMDNESPDMSDIVGAKKGGMMKHKDVQMDKKVVKKAVAMHDKQQHGGKKTNLSTLKKGGMACAPKKMARGGGIEIKGKTKGKMITMKKGGSC